MLRSKLAPSFDEPLEMLEACHERIEAQLHTLERLPAHLARHGADAAAQEAARAVMRYFDTAGVHHHEDEERDLFPALRAAAARAGRGEVAAAIDALEGEHAAMRVLYERLRAGLEALCAGSAGLREKAAAEFARLYRRHMRTEAQLVFPFAREILGEQARAALGGSMAARRGASKLE
ncbi:MAG TPA: hemerythrin domain-containing protein [Burkholderiales bacterium]|nr:hemerythrin domain-containing protein [Burkholderiales bacterium]